MSLNLKLGIGVVTVAWLALGVTQTVSAMPLAPGEPLLGLAMWLLVLALQAGLVLSPLAVSRRGRWRSAFLVAMVPGLLLAVPVGLSGAVGLVVALVRGHDLPPRALVFLPLLYCGTGAVWGAAYVAVVRARPMVAADAGRSRATDENPYPVGGPVDVGRAE